MDNIQKTKRASTTPKQIFDYMLEQSENKVCSLSKAAIAKHFNYKTPTGLGFISNMKELISSGLIEDISTSSRDVKWKLNNPDEYVFTNKTVAKKEEAPEFPEKIDLSKLNPLMAEDGVYFSLKSIAEAFSLDKTVIYNACNRSKDSGINVFIKKLSGSKSLKAEGIKILLTKLTKNLLPKEIDDINSYMEKMFLVDESYNKNISTELKDNEVFKEENKNELPETLGVGVKEEDEHKSTEILDVDVEKEDEYKLTDKDNNFDEEETKNELAETKEDNSIIEEKNNVTSGLTRKNNDIFDKQQNLANTEANDTIDIVNKVDTNDDLDKQLKDIDTESFDLGVDTANVDNINPLDFIDKLYIMASKFTEFEQENQVLNSELEEKDKKIAELEHKLKEESEANSARMEQTKRSLAKLSSLASMLQNSEAIKNIQKSRQNSN